MDVSVVIPNYQGRELLPRTLGHLREVLAATQLSVEVIVVDDGSRDGSAEYVRSDHPWVRLVALPRNGGFSGAVNAGGREAQAPLIYFMNSDVFPCAGFLEPLVRSFASDPNQFAAASLNLNPAGQPIPPGQVSPELRRGQIRVKGFELDRLWQAGRLAHHDPIPTLFGTGGSVLVHRARFLQLDGFAEIFRPYYYEDTDLGWRAWRRGWSSVLVPDSVVVHDHKFSTIQSTQSRLRVKIHKKRNRFLLVWRNYLEPSSFVRDHLARIPLHLLGRLIASDTVTIRGFWAALRCCGEVRAHRRAERAAAKITERELFARLGEVRQQLHALAGAVEQVETGSPSPESD
ncbi:MAG: glycosyltransferase family 2 protein [Planctomycetota bacterium]